MCWGAISAFGKSKLIFLENNCNKEEYIKTLQKANVQKFLRNLPVPNPLLMEDGATAHTAKVTKDWKAAHGIKVLDGWPGNSPDLNPIENVWGLIKTKISHENPTTIAEMKTICQRVWHDFTPDYLATLTASMPRRIEAVLKNEGGSTKY